MQELRIAKHVVTSAHIFVGAFVTMCAVAAVLIGSFPLAASVATIFLFAGAHNLMEFRYFIARDAITFAPSTVPGCTPSRHLRLSGRVTKP